MLQEVDNSIPSITEEISDAEKVFCYIDLVPNLVLSQIFRKLSPSDRILAIQVCSRWDDVVNEMVGLTKYVGTKPRHGYSKKGTGLVKTWSALETIENVGIDHCIFGDITESSDLDVELPLFWNPDIVDEIKFFGKISHSYFMELTKPLRFLTSLSLHLTAFVETDFTAKNPVEIRCLKSLLIVYTHPIDNLDVGLFNAKREEALHTNLTTFFTTSTFRGMKTLLIETPYFKARVEALYQALQNFVIRHEDSLKDLTFRSPYSWNSNNQPFEIHPPSAAIGWGRVQLETLDLVPASINHDLGNSDNDFNEDGELNLNELRRRKQEQNKYWNSLISGLLRLKKLRYINPDETWSLPKSIFVNNENSLDSVTLTVSSTNVIDCTALEACSNLTKLILHGARFRPINYDEDEDEKVPRFINAHKLSQTLEEINIAGILISTAELEAMFRIGQLPHLKSLTLFWISEAVENCGFTLKTVNDLLTKSDIAHIYLTKSFNKWNVVQGFQKMSQGLHDEEVRALEYILTKSKGIWNDDEKTFFNHPENLHLNFHRPRSSDD